jgi:ribosomal protein L20A (L18A)
MSVNRDGTKLRKKYTYRVFDSGLPPEQYGRSVGPEDLAQLYSTTGSRAAKHIVGNIENSGYIRQEKNRIRQKKNRTKRKDAWERYYSIFSTRRKVRENTMTREELIEAIITEMKACGNVSTPAARPPSAHKNWGLLAVKKASNVFQDKGEGAVQVGKAFK